MNCDVGEATERLENELCSFSNPYIASPTSQLTASFSNPYIASPMSQLILQPFHCFTYVTAHSTTLLLLHLHHRNFTYVTWRAAHVCHTFHFCLFVSCLSRFFIISHQYYVVCERCFSYSTNLHPFP